MHIASVNFIQMSQKDLVSDEILCNRIVMHYEHHQLHKSTSSTDGSVNPLVITSYRCNVSVNNESSWDLGRSRLAKRLVYSQKKGLPEQAVITVILEFDAAYTVATGDILSIFGLAELLGPDPSENLWNSLYMAREARNLEDALVVRDCSTGSDDA